MRLVAPLLFSIALTLGGCGQSPAHAFPAPARAEFERTCPADDPVCECTWDQLTRSMTYEEYEGALERYRSEGLMDPHITRARTHCLERQPT